MKVDFCLPIRNEAKVLEANILKVIAYLEGLNLDYDWRIIGIVNGSNDDSFNILCKLKENLPNKIDCLNIIEPGKGRAIKACWRQSQADILVFMDADLAVSLSGLELLLEPILHKQADLVIGSRFIKGATAERSWQRGIISKSYALFSQFILSHNKSDLQCGFKAIRRDAFYKIDKFLEDDFWFFDTELVILAVLAGLQIKEIPVVWRENRQGKEKSNVNVLQDSWSFIYKILSFRKRLMSIKKYLRNA